MAAIVGNKAPRTLTMPTWVIYRGSTAAAE
jgi:hypothetical protein